MVPAALAGSAADDLFRKANRASRQGRHVEAYLLYSRARALDPARLEYARAAGRVRRQAAQLLAAAGEHRAAIEMAPDSWEFERLAGERRNAGDAGAAPAPGRTPAITRPRRLRYAGHAASFQFRGSLREAYAEAVAEFGVRVVFHEDFDADRRIRADLSECGFLCVMRALGELGRAFAVPLGDDVLLVATDSSDRRAELETAAFAKIPIDGAFTPEDVAQVSQAVQQVLDIRRLQAPTSAGGVLLRDTVSKVDMARLLLGDLLHPPAAAILDIRLLTVARSRQVRAGIDLPASFPVANLSTLFGATPGAAGTARLIAVGGGDTLLGLTVGDASLEARLDASAAESLRNAQVRSLHGAKADFKVGESYPIATAQYSSGGSRPRGEGYVQPPPSITFQDLGLVLSVTPLIHSSAEVTLLLEASFKFLAGGAVNGVPVLGNREFQSRVRLRTGEFAIVSGTAVYERRRLSGGLAGLRQIPWLGALFRRNERRWSRRELLVLVRPRVVRPPPGELARASEFLFGSETRPVPSL